MNGWMMDRTNRKPNEQVFNSALPLTEEERAALDTFLRLLAAFFILVPFSYLPATYAAFSVRERAVQVRVCSRVRVRLRCVRTRGDASPGSVRYTGLTS